MVTRLLQRYLSDARTKLVLAAGLVQIANFTLLLASKIALSEESFAFLLTQLAVAGIIGAIASMRLEVLVFQAYSRMNYAAIVTPIVTSAAVVSAALIIVAILSSMRDQAFFLSMLSIPMMMGLALSAIQNFALVQVNKLNALLAARATQAVALFLLTLVLATVAWTPSGREILLLVGLCYAIPPIIGLVQLLTQITPKKYDPPPFYLPHLGLIKRALSLTISTGINSVYVNLPLLIASASQSAGYVADFGLILRAFTAPITLVSQVIGRLFLADALRWSARTRRTSGALKSLISRTIFQSVAGFLLISPLLVGVLYLCRDALKISHIELSAYLFFATLGQCAVNPVSQVRIPLADERAFLLIDAMRLFALTVGLLGLASIMPFELAFAVTASVLYSSYIMFIFSRVSLCRI